MFCDKHGIEYKEKIIKVGTLEIPSNCPKCEEEVNQRREEEKIKSALEKQEADRVAKENRLRNAGVSERYIKEGFKTSDFCERYKRFLEIENGDLKITRNLLIFSGCGVGKSFLCYRLIEVAQSVGLNYQIIKARELRDIFKQTKEPGGFRFNSVENVERFIKGLDCIIIDEVDDIFTDLEVLKIIVSLCYDKMIRMILVGNCTGGEFKDKIEAKTYSRLAGASMLGGNFKDLRRESNE